MLCYSDLKQLYAATAKERDELKRENRDLKNILWKQAKANRSMTMMALELDMVTADRDALLARLEGGDG